MRGLGTPSLRAAIRALGASAAIAACQAAHAAPSDTEPGPVSHTVVVTATKLPSDIANSPALISVVTGDDIRARGARDLRSALALVAGVDIAPGGDGGPAGAVPALWGLREIDAYLLVVDGVPYGGAFNPAVASVNLANVDRIEVLRGAAPVMYGATSFVGVIHVIHAEAGTTHSKVDFGAGELGFLAATLETDLAASARSKYSLTLTGEQRDFRQDDSRARRVQGLFRTTSDLSAGRLESDVEITSLHQDPYSPHPREGTSLSTRMPLDANVNPSDGRADSDRAQATLRFERPMSAGPWRTTLSYSHTRADNTRGFLREDFATDGVTPNADGFRQQVDLDDVYFDSFVAVQRDSLSWITGIDYMYGHGRQRSANFEYAVLADGSNRQPSRESPVDESTELVVERNFLGVYTQAEWVATDSWHLTAGVRWNNCRESREGALLAAGDSEEEREGEEESNGRFSGVLGTSFEVFDRNREYLTLFGNYRETFKPAAADFGPEAEVDMLDPETASGWEAGIRGALFDGRLHFESSYFHLDLENMVIRENIEGLPGLANAGQQRFTGVEFEGGMQLAPDFTLAVSYAYHEARFTDYLRLTDSGLQQLAGNYLELSPRQLAAAGLVFSPREGFRGSAVWHHSGERFLNKSNTARASGFDVIDASAGFAQDNWELQLVGTNISNRRDPVAESELGDAQFYRLNGRVVSLWWSHKL